MDKAEKMIINVLKIILSLISMVICGFVIMNLWQWFIVPLGVIKINLFHAIGIDILLSFICKTRIETDENYQDKVVELGNLISNGIVFPITVLFLGYFIQMFI